MVCDDQCAEVAGETSYCGDRVVDAANGEACDSGANNSSQCRYGLRECEVCTDQCAQVAGEVRYCGDGVLDADGREDCDDGNDDDADACPIDCTQPRCGDRHREGDEVCDGEADCYRACSTRSPANAAGIFSQHVRHSVRFTERWAMYYTRNGVQKRVNFPFPPQAGAQVACRDIFGDPTRADYRDQANNLGELDVYVITCQGDEQRLADCAFRDDRANHYIVLRCN